MTFPTLLTSNGTCLVLALLVLMTGCSEDGIGGLCDVDEAPPPPTSSALLDVPLGAGRIQYRGEGLRFSALLDQGLGGSEVVVLGPDEQRPQRVVINPFGVDVGDIVSGSIVRAGITYQQSANLVEYGQGSVRVERGPSGEIEGVFSGCIATDNKLFEPPGAVIHGGFRLSQP